MADTDYAARKYEALSGQTWVDASLFPESIPHLLHWDLAYLWVLEKPNQLRPTSWARRIEAWRYVVQRLLLGKLEIEHEELTVPLRSYAEQFGITTISWLRPKEPGGATGPRIAILSPTVLARPLPAFSDSDLGRWRQDFGEIGDADGIDLSHFVRLAIDRLERRSERYAKRLAAILKQQFEPARVSSSARGEFLELRLLNTLAWSPRDNIDPLLRVDILVRGRDEGKTFVPTCSNAACEKSLTRRVNDPPIQVAKQGFRVRCRCQHDTDLDLADFLIWYDDSGEGGVSVWNRDTAPIRPPNKGMPPRAIIRDGRVSFEFNPALLHGVDDDQCHFALEFGEVRVAERDARALFYKRLLVPGDKQGFTGLPIKPEWLHAVANVEEIAPAIDRDTGHVSYRKITIKGLPEPVFHSAGGGDLKEVPSLSVGLYPAPEFVPAEWQWFRAFLDGAGRRGYEIASPQARSLLPWVCESETGLPAWIGVSEAQSGDIGATFLLNGAGSSAEGDRVPVHLGVDFGTTNSILRYIDRADGDAGTPVTPRELSELVHWPARAASRDDNVAPGDFLPPVAFGSSSDPHLIPSALWTGSEQPFIRWSDKPALPGAEAWARFKWDRDPGENQERRRAFLRELLLLTLPQVFRNRRLRCAPELVCGAAYPLAFGYTARENYRKLWQDTLGEIERLTGATTQLRLIDESMASVNGYGRANPGTTYLVADMGGGTLDLASRREGADQAKRDKLVWELRDEIFTETCWRHYGDDAGAGKLLLGFLTLAFECLRTMAAAQSLDGGIRLLLVGNGWRLVEGFSSGTTRTGADHVFEEYYDHLIRSLGPTDFELLRRKGDEVLRELESPKHLVALGALKNAKDDRSTQAAFIRMPAGRDVTITLEDGTEQRVKWDEMVGDTERLADRDLGNIEQIAINVDYAQFPPAGDQWLRRLGAAFGKESLEDVPAPTTERMGSWLTEVLEPGPPPRLRKGPLQLLMEKDWPRKLV